MAKVILQPIGDELTQTPDLERINALDAKLTAQRDEMRLGWGEKYQDRVHKRGKMTSWERVLHLADDPNEIRPIGTFVNHGEHFGPAPGRKSPAAGVVTAFVKVEDRWVVAIANDNTVASGSWWPRTPEKIIRAQEIRAAFAHPRHLPG